MSGFALSFHDIASKLNWAQPSNDRLGAKVALVADQTKNPHDLALTKADLDWKLWTCEPSPFKLTKCKDLSRCEREVNLKLASLIQDSFRTLMVL